MEAKPNPKRGRSPRKCQIQKGLPQAQQGHAKSKVEKIGDRDLAWVPCAKGHNRAKLYNFVFI